MAKKTVKKKSAGQRRIDLRDLQIPQAPEIVVMTSRGVEWRARPVAEMFEAMEENVKNAFDWPDVPTRELQDVAEEGIRVPLTEDYLKSGYATDEEKVAWGGYLLALEAVQAEFNAAISDARTAFLANESGEPVDESLKGRWREWCARMHMKVPEDPWDENILLFRTWIIGNAMTDPGVILAGVYKASGYDRQMLEEYEAFFRSEMGLDAGPPGPSGS